MKRPTDEELLAVYNAVFDRVTATPTMELGDAHITALRAVWEKGATDAEKQS